MTRRNPTDAVVAHHAGSKVAITPTKIAEASTSAARTGIEDGVRNLFDRKSSATAA